MAPSTLRNHAKPGLTAIVGIAADVGDEREVSTIVGCIPHDLDVAFLVLPSASSNQGGELLLASLQQASHLPVLEATTGTVLRSHRVYVAPPGAKVVVEDLRLHISPGTGTGALDTFFTSLAADQGERAIGIKLSPEAEPGQAGLHAIDSAGGCTLGGFPKTRAVGDRNSDRTTDDVLKRLAEHVTNLQARKHGPPSKRRRQRSQLTSLREPAKPEAPSAPLIDPVAPGSETGPRWGEASSVFFRDQNLYDRLSEHLSGLFHGRARQRLRMWVPCSGTGQSAYSLAMLLSERRPAGASSPQVFATDADPLAVAVARDGRYPEAALLTLSADRRQRFFVPGDGGARVKGALRHQLLFAVHDVLYSPPLSRIDLLCAADALAGCSDDLLERLLARFHFALRPGGWLLAGPEADRLTPLLFENIDSSCGLFRARKVAVTSRNSYLGLARPAPSTSQTELRALSDELKGLSSQRLMELERLDRAHADLKNFVEATGLLACICDADLAITRASTALRHWCGFAVTEPGFRLDDVADRLPGGAALVGWADVVQRTGVPMEGTEWTQGESRQAFLLRITPYQNQRGDIDGVVLVFTEVTALEEARALTAKRERQQAAIAELGLAALVEPASHAAAPSNLFEKALDCVVDRLNSPSAVILECGLRMDSLVVRAAHAWPAEGVSLAGLTDDDRLRRALAAKGPILLGKVADAPASLDEARSSAGIACPLRVGAAVYGVLAACLGSDRGPDRDDLNFVQAVANVVAGAVGRQRVRRRLALEREVSLAVSESDDVTTMAERVEAALGFAFGSKAFVLWGRNDVEGSDELVRLYPMEPRAAERAASRATVPDWAAEVLERKRATWSAPKHSGNPTVELGFPVLLGTRAVGVATCHAVTPIVVEEEAMLGLERAGRAIGEFLQRMRMNAALQESEQRYRAQSTELETIYATLPVGLSLHDRSLRMVRANQRLLELGSAARGEPILAEAMVRSVLEKGEAIEGVEVTTLSDDGPRSWLCGLAPLKDTHGHVMGVSSVVQDITERKRMEQALLEADRQKDEFLAMLGHELRNPLAAIRGATELLQRSASSHPELDRVQGVLLRQTAQMAKLIDGLLDVSRIIRGKLLLDWSTVDLCRLVKEVVQDYHGQLVRRGLAVVLGLPEAPLWVHGDRVRLVQVIDNLLSNAAKFTPENGCLQVRARAENEHAVLEVEDNGIGIDPELLPHIFEPFRQAKQTSDRSLGGLGLGLSLVHGLITLHGGRVSATDAPSGRGALFVVELPLSEEPGLPTTMPPPRVDTLRVVIVEDNADMAEMMGELLALSGHQVLAQASSAEEGIARALVERPDVVLCDLGLPGDLDGFDVARMVRAKVGQSMMLVAVTGYGGPEIKKRATQAGFDAVLVKPVSLEALNRQLAYIARRLGRQH